MGEQHEFVSDKPKIFWQGYTPDISIEDAIKAFTKKFRYAPGGHKLTAACLLVGPLKEKPGGYRGKV